MTSNQERLEAAQAANPEFASLTGAERIAATLLHPEILSAIQPLHPTILAAYRGTIIETQGDGRTTVIRFDSAHRATSWAQTCKIEDRTFFAYANGRGLALPCDIVYHRPV